jgi:mycothiol synthase
VHGAKSHQHDGQESHDHAAIGEIYITGVDSAFEGLGLGKVLTSTGLNYLKYQGIEDGILYVDEENKFAFNFYRKLGFKIVGEDIVYKKII